MVLNIRWVRSLADIVEPVAAWANEQPTGRSLFDPDHLLVPSNGVKAWLVPELAQRVGTRTGNTDGVVANVRVGYLGSLQTFVVPQRYRTVDPWSVESMTGVILGVIAHNPDYAAIIKRCGGALQAARRLAERFDRYHVRRPMMIRAWEAGSPVMAPTTADSFNDGEWRAGDLGQQRWQFELWTSLRDVIGVPSWPVTIASAVQQLRAGNNAVGVPERLMVAGMQSLSLGSVELLEAFGHVSNVDVLLVHPSASLATTWQNDLADTEVRRGALQVRPTDEPVSDQVHPLIFSWLRGSRELQQLVTSQGLSVAAHEPAGNVEATTLLQRIQAAVGGDGSVTKVPHSPDDLSVQVHRCYNLTRQVEVLHDALLHAFCDVPDLAPHEVVIVSPRLSEAAPILEAVFDRTVKVQVGDDVRDVRIPLAIAERELRHVNPGAEFLAQLLQLLTGRFDVASFMAVATSPLVMQHLGVDDDVVSVWQRQIARTRVRWGLSAQQRAATGLAPEAESAHTWKAALERSLLGAALPDDTAAIEMGGVVPLVDVSVDDIDALARLVQVFDAIEQFEMYARGDAQRDIHEWCTLIEHTVVALCGEGDDSSGALELISSLARSTTLIRPDQSTVRTGAVVAFADVAAHLLGDISGVPGFQPFRTGAVTATSLKPLRGVPYRVVCLLGIDDGVFGGGEPESDDLIGHQVFIGDDDPRIDVRRQMLDSVLAAGEQVIITCDGRSIQNNQNIPLTTALAELVDFARDLGVADREKDEGCDIEFLHPRHATSVRNFKIDKVVPGRIWAHGLATRDVAERVGRDRQVSATSRKARVLGPDGVVDYDDLSKFVRSPLEMFMNDVMGINTWVDDSGDPAATIPLDVERRTKRDFIGGYIAGASGAVPGWDKGAYIELARLNGDIPIGAYGDAVIDDMVLLADEIISTAQTYSVTPIAPEPVPVMVSLGDGVSLRGNIAHVQNAEQLVGVVKSSKTYTYDLTEAALRLMVLAASGADIRRAVTVHAHDKGQLTAQARMVYLGPDVDASEASDRLLQLVNLMARASTTPVPSFGTTVDKIFKDPARLDLEAGKAEFDKWVRGDKFKSSLERRIYGDAPRFSDIFDLNGPVIAFWAELHGVLHLTTKKADGFAGKLPHANTHRGVF